MLSEFVKLVLVLLIYDFTLFVFVVEFDGLALDEIFIKLTVVSKLLSLDWLVGVTFLHDYRLGGFFIR